MLNSVLRSCCYVFELNMTIISKISEEEHEINERITTLLAKKALALLGLLIIQLSPNDIK